MARSVLELNANPAPGSADASDKLIAGAETDRQSVAETDLQTLLDAVPAYIAWLDRDCRYIRLNKAYEAGFGLKAKDILGLRVSDVFGAEYFEFIQPYIERALAGETLDFDTQADIPRGNPRQLRVRYTPKRAVDGSVDGVIAVVRDVTSEKRTEQELRHAAQRFRLALNNSRTSVFEQDLDLRYTWAYNDSVLFQPQTLLGKKDEEVNPGTWCAELGAVKRRVIETGRSARCEIVIPIMGEPNTYDMTIEARRDESGRIDGISVSAVDITALKLAEKQIRESEARYRMERERFALIFEQSPVGIAVMHGQNLILEMANPATYALLPGRNFTGFSLMEAIPELDPKLVEVLRKVIASGQPFESRDYELQLDTARNGVLESRWFDLVFNPLKEADGSVNSLIAVTTEVTDRMLSAKEMLQQWRMFDTALSNTPDFVYILDRDGRFLYANRAFSSLFERPMSEVIGRTMEETGLYREPMLGKLLGQIRHVMETHEPVLDETTFAGADGHPRTYEYIFAAVVNEDGTVDRVAGSSRDITERKRRVDQLKESMEQLKRTNRELEEFAYVASHDLQEPLRTVNAYSQLLLRGMRDDDPKLRQYADYVRRAVRRMEELIRDLLSFSRVIHDDGAPTGNADLAVALRRATEALQTVIGETGATITAEQLPTVRGDVAQLEHVLQNLLSNALKYRRPGVAPVIQISCERGGVGWIISVTDNGIGFDQQYATRIFGLFKRLHKDEYPGTGLGLAICQRIVERSGGQIWAESKPGEGSVFRFSLVGA